MTARTLTYRTPLAIIVAGFAVVLAVNSVLVYFAINSWTGLETEQHFVKGLKYNDALAAADRQKQLGWRLDLTPRWAEGDGDTVVGTISVVLADRDGQPLTDLAVHLMAVRPTHEGHDREVGLTHRGQGRYVGRIELPLRGQWQLRVLASRGEDDFQHVERITTP